MKADNSTKEVLEQRLMNQVKTLEDQLNKQVKELDKVNKALEYQ